MIKRRMMPMIYINRDHKVFSNSYESQNGIVTGTAFIGYRSLYGEDFLNYVSSWETEEEWKQGLLDLNGFFAIIISKNNKVFVAVDRIRSLPLFYGLHEGNLFISNDARWVRDQVGDKEMDPLAKEEFLLTGFVVGPDTLFPKVKQVQAGEVVFFSREDDGKVRVEPQRYYRYLHSNYYKETEEELQRMFDDVLQNVFQRLVTYAHGRTIVVPLSGGYDSRLIVLMLKRLGYENVIAFSYGRPGNEEAEISRFVAGKLGIRWEFVPYSNKLWYEWYRSPEMKAYFEFADNLASLPHIQDWPAVKVLKQEKRIPDDSIFVPGIAADLNTGGFIEKYPKIYSTKARKEDLVRLIEDYSYSLYPLKSVPIETQTAIRKRIDMVIGGYPYGEPWGESFECWVSTEKVAKFVLNSVRVYEFFGYDWWTPFWDKEFVDFLYNVPDELRSKQRLYKSLIKELSEDLGFNEGIDPLFRDGNIKFKLSKLLGCPISPQVMFEKQMIKIAKRVLPEKVKNRLRKIREIHSFKKHPMAWYGIHEDGDVQEKIRNGATMINSLLAMDYIEFLSSRSAERFNRLLNGPC
ncbi:MAG TPA: hypothetical protein DCP10_09975 [Bacteroidales bacterium]|nr:hypothetical protein [Bacteroidales bacterium]